jgi:hypothetical protein
MLVLVLAVEPAIAGRIRNPKRSKSITRSWKLIFRVSCFFLLIAYRKGLVDHREMPAGGVEMFTNTIFLPISCDIHAGKSNGFHSESDPSAV